MRIVLTAVIMALMVSLSLAEAEGQRRIVLSFDDPPRGDGALYSGQDRTDRLIEALQASGSGPVLFFVTTQGLERHESGRDRLLAYAEAGHILANHSHTHMWAHRTPAQDYLADIDIAAGYLETLPNTRPWFRFPFLDEGRRPDQIAALAEGLDARGLANGYVTVDTYDWHLEMRFQQALSEGCAVNYDALGALYVSLSVEAAAYYDAVASDALGDAPVVHVLLLHENDLAARFAADLVDGLRNAGWEIVHPDQAYRDPLPTPQTPLTGQGRVAALAIDAGRDPRTIVHWGIDAALIDAQIEASGVFGD